MLLIDTNIFLEVMLGQTRQHDCAEFLTQVRTGGKNAAVTNFSIYSIMIVLAKEKKLPELNTFLHSLSAYAGLTIHVPSTNDLIEAAKLLADGKFDIDDGIQYASANSLSSEGIVSLDKHFDNQEIPRIEPAPPQV